ncbi:hypothetical protein ASPCADRAFT_127857 [Aspergillus carbonarius ITEM 5010]|uniref:Uncharacterized protein n=1 Tax=Aspergillus carbonarius (strain ITEM 5010) TaxID=602072 RepID=A0A1R3RXS1_ASPC5|nr:hypothetical protein ASPCADRAFT_127857 [Aspergillus carbonarius ITEM 5010]
MTRPGLGDDPALIRSEAVAGAYPTGGRRLSASADKCLLLLPASARSGALAALPTMFSLRRQGPGLLFPPDLPRHDLLGQYRRISRPRSSSSRCVAPEDIRCTRVIGYKLNERALSAEVDTANFTFSLGGLRLSALPSSPTPGTCVVVARRLGRWTGFGHWEPN